MIMNLIDREELISKIPLFGAMTVQKIECLINQTPTVDAVEVVRCKDCQYYKLTNKEKGFGKCTLIGDDDIWNDTDYCSYGIRKMDGD